MSFRPFVSYCSMLSLLFGSVAIGCGGSSAALPSPTSPSGGQAASVTPGTAGSSAASPASSPAASSAKAPPRLRPLFGDAAHPTLFRPAASLSLGMPLAEARRAVPALFEHDPLRTTGLDDVAMAAHADSYGRLGSLTMTLGCDSALRDVTELWGAPTAGDDPRAKERLSWWFDPAARLRATLVVPAASGTCSLVFDRYLPLAELLGPGDAKFGFERQPLSGMSSADVARVFSDYLSEPSDDPCKSQILVLPPVEYDRVFTRVRLSCGKTGVGSFDVIVNYAANPGLRTEVVDWLTRKFGRPTEKGTSETLVFPPATSKEAASIPPRGVRLRNSASMKDLTIEVYRP